MSVRRRAIAARTERDRRWQESFASTTSYMHEYLAGILARILNRDANQRMDDDGAPPIG